jgi:hypothetical protein
MNEIVFESQSPDSRKLAIFEDNGTSAWLYLASSANHEVEKDAFVYSPQEPRSELNWSGMKEGEPPILVVDYASSDAVREIEDENELSIVWSQNGKSLALFHNADVLAAIYEDDDQGYSKALSKRCGFGKPWSDQKFEKYFSDVE